MREQLKAWNGLPDLADFAVPGGEASARRAAALLRRAGFVVILDAVPPAQCEALLEACHREAAELLCHDALRHGNRGFGRYSLGAAQKTGHLLHRKEWAGLADLPAVSPLLCELFGEGGYICAGAGGDFVLGGVDMYQNLHSDLNASGSHEREDPPVVTVNVAVTPLTWENGPTRIIPGTHRLSPGCFWPPSQPEENEAWRLFTVCPLPAGTAVVRDNRTWHGGTPNLSAEARFLPNCEFAARWWCRGTTSSLWRNPWVLAPQCMPREVFESLSETGRLVCRDVVATEVLDYGVRADLGGGL